MTTAPNLPRIITTTAICALLLTGCAPGSDDSAKDPSATAHQSTNPAPGEGTFTTADQADRTDADSTAETAALMLHSWDTTTDSTETAAAVRTKPLMSPEWAKNQIEPQRNVSQAEWIEPGKHSAYSAPVLTDAGGDAAAHDYGPNRAERHYEVTWTWTGRDGTTLPADSTREVVVFLERNGKTWEVVGHDSNPITGQNPIDSDQR